MSDAAAQAPDPGQSAFVSLLPQSPDEISAWIDESMVGDSIVYFVGHLVVARDPRVTMPAGAANKEDVADVADALLRHAGPGGLRLTQRRVADGCFLYTAKRVSRTIH